MPHTVTLSFDNCQSCRHRESDTYCLQVLKGSCGQDTCLLPCNYCMTCKYYKWWKGKSTQMMEQCKFLAKLLFCQCLTFIMNDPVYGAREAWLITKSINANLIIAIWSLFFFFQCYFHINDFWREDGWFQTGKRISTQLLTVLMNIQCNTYI